MLYNQAVRNFHFVVVCLLHAQRKIVWKGVSRIYCTGTLCSEFIRECDTAVTVLPQQDCYLLWDLLQYT